MAPMPNELNIHQIMTDIAPFWLVALRRPPAHAASENLLMFNPAQ